MIPTDLQLAFCQQSRRSSAFSSSQELEEISTARVLVMEYVTGVLMSDYIVTLQADRARPPAAHLIGSGQGALGTGSVGLDCLPRGQRRS
jgi:hypothetical protein